MAKPWAFVARLTNIDMKPAYYQPYFGPQEFKRRHEKIYDAIGPKAIAVLQGAPPVPGFEIPRQTNEFFYLSGTEAPLSYMILDGRSRTSTLYLPHRDMKHAESEGAEITADDVEEAIALTGFKSVKGSEHLSADLKGASVIYTPHQPAEGNMACQDTLRHAAKLIAADPWSAGPTREADFASRLLQHAKDAEIRDLSPILNNLRLDKSKTEIDVMRRAGHLTSLSVIEAMKSTRPGVYEYQLGAIAEYVYRINDSRGAGYRPIIAAGENIWTIHYYRNNKKLLDGELVLMDVAPDLYNYTSDIGRMWPVNGKYSDSQRSLYGFMVAFHKCLLRRLGPGLTPTEILTAAGEDMKPYVAKMKFATPAQEAGVHKALTLHNALTHPVGMAVHDVGTYKPEPLKAGLVFALDPQMWVPEEKLYVRVEDTVVITDNGVENLTPQAPLELDEVEALIKKGGGMLQQFPAVGV